MRRTARASALLPLSPKTDELRVEVAGKPPSLCGGIPEHLLGDTDIDVGEWEPFTSGPHNRFGGVIVVEGRDR